MTHAHVEVAKNIKIVVEEICSFIKDGIALYHLLWYSKHAIEKSDLIRKETQHGKQLHHEYRIE